MELQHVNVKIYVQDPHKLDMEQLNPVFQTWIQKKLAPELLIDVASYLHVPAGPGMVLVGLEADYSLDNTNYRWGLRYNRKSPVSGNNQDRFHQAVKSALEGCLRLESDERLKDKIKFRSDEVELFINDRALAPNNPETFAACKGELEGFFKKLFGGNPISLERNEDPRQRFGVTIKTEKKLSIEELLKNL